MRLGRSSTETIDESMPSEVSDGVGVKPVDPITSEELSYRNCRNISRVAAAGPSVQAKASNGISNQSN